MSKRFISVNPKDISENAIKLIGHDWMLLTSGTKDKMNAMTVSWGGIGVLWHKPVIYVVVRPQRYTFELMEQNEFFSLSIFAEQYRHILNTCGTKSGRECNKIVESGLTPLFTGNGVPYFEQARLVFECRKMYYSDVDPKNFIDIDIDKNYPNKDYHRMYFAEITHCFVEGDK